MNTDSLDGHGFSELERRNRARLEAFNEYSRLQSTSGADSRVESFVDSDTRGFDGDDTEHALAGADAETLAVEVEERERPLDVHTWHTLQRIVDEPPGRPALPIARDKAVERVVEPSVTVGDVISLCDWAEVRALYAAEIRRTPFA